MLPKITYGKLIKRLEQIKINWAKDAETAPYPYCIRSVLRDAIDHLITQDKINPPLRASGHTGRTELINQTIAYLVSKNLVSCPLTGSGILYPVSSVIANQLASNAKLRSFFQSAIVQ